MKVPPKYFSIAALAISSLATQGFAVTEATTDPVGFITVTAAGGSINSPKLSLVSPTLTRPIEYQGAITAISPTTVTVSGTPWAVGQFSGANGEFYVELISSTTPTNSGAIGDVTATPTTNSITLASSLPGAVVGDSIKIRKHVTIANFLGATNSYGLLASDDAASADEVLIYNGASSTSYFYYVDASHTADGWYNSATFNPAGSEVIGLNDGVVIKRKAAGSVSIVSTGAVKTGNTKIPIVNGLNVLGTVSAKGLTLGTSGLYTGNILTGVKPSDDASSADELTIYSTTGQKNYFYYVDASHTVDGWYDSGEFTDATNIAIVPGTSFVVTRKGGSPFNWPLPSPTSF